MIFKKDTIVDRLNERLSDSIDLLTHPRDYELLEKAKKAFDSPDEQMREYRRLVLEKLHPWRTFFRRIGLR